MPPGRWAAMLASAAGQRSARAMRFLVKGMPHSYYANGAGRGSRTAWIGATRFLDDDPHDVRRLYQREDGLPLREDGEPSSPSRSTNRRLIRRVLGLSRA